MFQDFYTVLIFLGLGGIFGVAALIVNWLVRPKNPTRDKIRTYECGLETQGQTWVQFKISYFLYALVFLVFDVETIFLYPFAVLFKSLGGPELIAVAIFLLILVIGLWYEWKEGALQWK
jgi:NADH:ubiquinone oxidoreductase subunit 3 (subunit A)